MGTRVFLTTSGVTCPLQDVALVATALTRKLDSKAPDTVFFSDLGLVVEVILLIWESHGIPET